MPAHPSGPLAGFTIGVTAARRAGEFVAMLQRRGAKTVHAPAIRIVPLVDDVELRRVTELLIADPPDVLVATTGIGFRGWIDAAHAWGLADRLVGTLGGVQILARGPKALGAIRQAGLREHWCPVSESSSEVVERLATEGTSGLRVAVQLHGAGSEWEPNADVCRALDAAGAAVIEVPVYRWLTPIDPAPMNRLITGVIAGRLDAVSFTSAPGVASLLQHAETMQARSELVDALRTTVTVACVGPITAAPLDRLGIPSVVPTRYRLGALARLLITEVPRSATRVTAGGHDLHVRSGGVSLDGQWRPVRPNGMAIMRRLIAAAGDVVSPEDLLAALPGERRHSVHSVQAGIARLRASLQAPLVIETVAKRGYRIALDVPTASSEST